MDRGTARRYGPSERRYSATSECAGAVALGTRVAAAIVGTVVAGGVSVNGMAVGAVGDPDGSSVEDGGGVWQAETMTENASNDKQYRRLMGPRVCQQPSIVFESRLVGLHPRRLGGVETRTAQSSRPKAPGRANETATGPISHSPWLGLTVKVIVLRATGITR